MGGYSHHAGRLAAFLVLSAQSSNGAQLVQQVVTAPWGNDACQARWLGALMRLIKLLGRGNIIQAEHSTLPPPTRLPASAAGPDPDYPQENA